jgi:hypothetical protein
VSCADFLSKIMSSSFLAACAIRSLDALDSPTVAPPPIARQSSTVFRELGHLIVGRLPLADLALIMAVDSAFRDNARARVAELLPKLSRLLISPFNLRKRDLFMTVLSLDDKNIGDGGVSVLADATACGALGSLQTLSLKRNQISDEGAKALAQVIYGSASVTSVRAFGNSWSSGDRRGQCSLLITCCAG